jgi:bifunctional non-homologous end joining protein LigD
MVGYYKSGKLVYAGRAGTGFNIKAGRELVEKLEGRRAAPPFVAVPRPDAKDALWVEPVMVVEVEFTTWTADGILSHPSFEGAREKARA